MLDVGPAGLAHRRHVEAVARGQERGLGRPQPVVVRLAALEPGIALAAALPLLDRLHPVGEGELGEAMSHASLS